MSFLPVSPVTDAPHAVVFTGSVSEYRPLWVRNTLLLFLTLGLSLPWAMVSKFQYFYRHTLVAGRRFDFHAAPLPMFVGNVIATVLLNLMYWGIAQTGDLAPYGVAAVQLLMAACLPLMLRGMAQFQLMHTSWGAQRFGFDGSVSQAYRAMGWATALYIASGAALVQAYLLASRCQGPQALAWGAAGLLGLCVSLPGVYVSFKAYQARYLRWGEAVPGSTSLGTAPPWPWRRVARVTTRAAAVSVAVVFGVLLPLAYGLTRAIDLDVMCLAQNQWVHPGWLGAMVLTAWTWAAIALLMGIPYALLGVQVHHHFLPTLADTRVRAQLSVPSAEHLRTMGVLWWRVWRTLGWRYPEAVLTDVSVRLAGVRVWLDLPQAPRS